FKMVEPICRLLAAYLQCHDFGYRDKKGLLKRVRTVAPDIVMILPVVMRFIGGVIRRSPPTL
ncbi:hypothetical protein, partial [Yersinia pseudotuberculosis]